MARGDVFSCMFQIAYFEQASEFCYRLIQSAVKVPQNKQTPPKRML